VSEEGGFTSAVRQELASLPIPSEREARAELAGMLLLGAAADGGRVRGIAGRRPGDIPLGPLCEGDVLRLDVPSSAVARRGIGLVQRALGVRPRLTAVSTTARRPHGPAYRVTVPATTVRARDAGRGARPVRPTVAAEVEATDGDAETAALLRGAMLVGGSISAPDRPVHLELSGISPGVAPLLIAALGQVIPAARPVHDPGRRRLVLKSGDVVADLLAALGATRAFLTFDDRRLRRQLRGEANRLANADAANLTRIARSAGAQVEVPDSLPEGATSSTPRASMAARVRSRCADMRERGRPRGRHRAQWMMSASASRAASSARTSVSSLMSSPCTAAGINSPVTAGAMPSTGEPGWPNSTLAIPVPCAR
jgi:DNA-binding protein WhiA